MDSAFSFVRSEAAQRWALPGSAVVVTSFLFVLARRA
jgi:hypothetical protein